MLIRAWLRMQERSIHNGGHARWRTGTTQPQTATVDFPLRPFLPRGRADEVELRPLQPDQWQHVQQGDVLSMVLGSQPIGEATVLAIHRPPRPWTG